MREVCVPGALVTLPTRARANGSLVPGLDSRACGIYWPLSSGQVLNVSKSRLGLPRHCIGRAGHPELQLLATPHDNRWPCGEPGTSMVASASSVAWVVNSPEPLNASDPTNLLGAINTMTMLQTKSSSSVH